MNLKECGGVTQSGVDDLLKRLNARSAIPFGQTSFIGVVEYRGGSQGKEDKRPVMTLRPGKAGSDSWREAVARAAKASGVDLRLDFQYVGMSDADAAHFGDFANLKVQVVAMNLDESTLTRDGISQLKKFPMLRDLSMGLAGVGDPELEAISQLSSLKRLGLNQSKITDGGLKHLVKMPALKSVDLRFAKITDEGLKNLVGTRLRYVDLAGTGASEEKLRELLSSK